MAPEPDFPAALRSASGFDLSRPSDEVLRRLGADLDDAARRVLLEHGTERPFCGLLWDHQEAGVYVCGLCALPLFTSETKFASSSGWPSFCAPFDPDHVAEFRDSSHGMIRTEIRCARCDGHLGHVFPDGPPPTGQRYCLNSVSLVFVRHGGRLPDKLGRGDPTDG